MTKVRYLVLERSIQGNPKSMELLEEFLEPIKDVVELLSYTLEGIDYLRNEL